MFLFSIMIVHEVESLNALVLAGSVCTKPFRKMRKLIEAHTLSAEFFSYPFSFTTIIKRELVYESWKEIVDMDVKAFVSFLPPQTITFEPV